MPGDPGSLPSEPSLGQIAKPVFIAWEKLRVVYVAVVGLFVVLLTGPQLLKLHTFVTIAGEAILANLCFFAGPCLETYVRWLGYRGRVVRWFLFILGTLFTLFLALMSLAGQLLLIRIEYTVTEYPGHPTPACLFQ